MWHKKKIQRIAGILTGLLIFTVISHVLNEMYVDVRGTIEAWDRILWHHFYEDAGKIDNIYLGSSHVHCDIDPLILDQLSGQYNFNLSTPGQRLNGSYYLLREACRTNEVSHVYLELYYGCIFSDNDLSYHSDNRVNVGYMRPSLNKAAYMMVVGGADQYVDILFPFSRHRKYLGDVYYLEKIYKEKRQGRYQNYEYEEVYNDGNGRCSYEKQGFLKNTRIYKDSDKIFRQGRLLNGYSMGEKTEEYCRGIIEYCQKKGIPITLFVSPINDLELISTLDYDDYSTEIRAFAAEYRIPFYDFNLAKEEYLPMQEGEYFVDAGHLNQYGAAIFTPFFYEVVNDGGGVTGKQADNERYFYDSYEEKRRELPPKIYGIYYEEPTEEKRVKTMWVASNRDSGMEYRITLTPEEGEPYMVQDFKENKKFEVPPEEKGVCKIETRMKAAPDTIQTMEISY